MQAIMFFFQTQSQVMPSASTVKHCPRFPSSCHPVLSIMNMKIDPAEIKHPGPHTHTMFCPKNR